MRAGDQRVDGRVPASEGDVVAGEQVLAGMAAEAMAQVQRLEQLERELAGIQGQGVSPRRYVMVRTGPGGRLLDLDLAEGVLRIGVDALTAELTAAVKAAQDDHDQQAAKVMQETLPAVPVPGTESLDAGLATLDGLTATLEGLTRRLAGDTERY